MVLPVEVVNESIIMDTPEAINSLSYHLIVNTLIIASEMMFEVTIRPGCELVTVNWDKCVKDISLDV